MSLKSNTRHIFILSIFILCGCTSPKYCSKENYAQQKERFSHAKCTASVAADVVLVTVAVVGVVAAAQSNSNNNSHSNSPQQGSSYDGNCPCPGDLDEQGNRCGLRSAYSRSGGAEPICIGRL